MKGFVDKSFEFDLDLSIINNALLLLGGLSATKAGLPKTGTPGSTGGGTPAVKPEKTPPPTVEPAKPTVTVEPAKPTVTVEPAKPTVTVEPAKPTVTVEPAKPTVTVEPAKPTVTVEPVGKVPAPIKKPPPTPEPPRSPAEIVTDLKQAGLTEKEILGLMGGSARGESAKLAPEQSIASSSTSRQRI